MTHAEMRLNLLQGLQMIPHVGERLLGQCRRKFHELPGVRRARRQHVMAVPMLGDGECEAGQIWEAAMAAAHFNAGNLVAILDYNKFQETGPISREMGLEPLVDKWRSFGWHVDEVDGHDIAAIIAKLRSFEAISNRPSILIAHTVKGKGVSFVETDFTWHGRALSPELAERARLEILQGELGS